jgi:DNA polymerase-4/protein ImuB
MRLACVTVPNFRIALERQRAPRLSNSPVAIGEPPPGENTVLDCSAAAAALGVRTGMPLRDARTILPDLVLLPPDPVLYARAFDAMLAALEDAAPSVEPGEPGTIFAELAPDPLWAQNTPNKQSNNQRATAEQDAAARLVHAIAGAVGVSASAGVGEGKFIAWVAATVSAPGDITIVPAGREQAFVAPLSTSFLPVSFETHRKLALYALTTVGDVARLPLGAAQAQFGREGKQLWELVRGIDAAPFRPRTRMQQVAGSLEMPSPTVNTGALLVAARQLAGRLLQQRAMRFRQVRQLRLRLSLLGHGSWERTLTFRDPLGDEEGIVFVLKKLIEPLQLAGPVEEMTLEFVGLTSETGKQRSLLFAEHARRREQLLAALRQLKARFGGESQVARVVEVEPWSRIPERRYALIDYDL